MIQFKVSAPYNLNLLGEPAVKYGKDGVMAGIELRTTLTFTELSELVIQLKFPQINLLLNIPLQVFILFCRQCDMRLLRQQVLQFITSNVDFSHGTENQKAIVQVFFYLLVYITYKKRIRLTSFCVELSAELNADTDYFCLTPATVCFATCFLNWSRLQNDSDYILNSHSLRKISLYAIKCKEITPNIEWASVTVCTYGSVIEYNNSKNYYQPISWLAENVTILLVDSKFTPNRENQTQRLIDLVNIHPIAAKLIFNKINFATSIGSNVFERLATLYEKEESNIESKRLKEQLEYSMLMTSIDLNQKSLQLLNLSHYYLDEICFIAQKHGMYGKCADIGNGRYAYIWCQPDMSERRIAFLSQDLKSQRFDVTRTSLAHCGVKIE